MGTVSRRPSLLNVLFLLLGCSGAATESGPTDAGPTDAAADGTVDQGSTGLGGALGSGWCEVPEDDDWDASGGEHAEAAATADGGLGPNETIDASLDGLLVDASLDGPVVDATLDEPVVDATLDGPVADATLDGPVVDASLDGQVVDASRPASSPQAFNLFSRLPQFGIYASVDPVYTPPPEVLMWNHGTVFLSRLSATQQAAIGADLAARITYHAQCDNYDRLGGLFYVVMPPGRVPDPSDSRIELVRFITPFSNRWRCGLATHVFPDSDISAHARALADPNHDIWVGLAGGSNPYDGDPCSTRAVSPRLKAIGFEYSVDFVSTNPLETVAGAPMAVSARYDLSAMQLPITATIDNPGEERSGHITVIVSGHGSQAGGVEYRFTQDTLLVNGAAIGSFSTRIDCAMYAKDSPDGNRGIFRYNGTTNPRNWCPGALIPAHTFAANLLPGVNTVSLMMAPTDVPSGSYYATSLTFTAP